MAAIGAGNGPVELYSIASGELIRRIGSFRDGPVQIGSVASGVRFSPDGTRILVAGESYPCLLLFTVGGAFIKRIAADVVSDCFKDVAFGAGGEIIVAGYDERPHHISVFSPIGGNLLKTWGAAGGAAGQFQNPNALAVCGPYLYVLDGSRVQVFE